MSRRRCEFSHIAAVADVTSIPSTRRGDHLPPANTIRHAGSEMRRTHNSTITAGLWLCLLALPLAGLIHRHPPPPPHPGVGPRVAHRPPAGPSEAALQEARVCWGEAQTAIKPELEALAASDPDTADAGRRQRLMERDQGGQLHRARAAAVRAVRTARSPEEAYEATLWLALIECDAGDHETELRHARRLVALQPRNPDSWGALRRAARCNGRGDLVQQAEVALEEMGTFPTPSP